MACCNLQNLFLEPRKPGQTYHFELGNSGSLRRVPINSRPDQRDANVVGI